MHLSLINLDCAVRFFILTITQSVKNKESYHFVLRVIA